MECAENDPFRSLINTVSVNDIRMYLRALFTALECVHGEDIIHRDIKPNNILFSQTTKSFLLIDFGLAQQVSHLLSYI